MAYDEILDINGLKLRDVEGRKLINQLDKNTDKHTHTNKTVLDSITQENIDNWNNSSSTSSGLALSQARPERARAWVQPTFPNYSSEFVYVDEWTQNTKFVQNSDKTAWVTSANEGTSCNENKMYLGNVTKLNLTNNTNSDMSYVLHYLNLEGSLGYTGGVVSANRSATIYCTLSGAYKYENGKLYIESLVNTGDLLVEALYE